jgi:predicted nuclease of predicted toxin-antitoxin system
VRVLLDENLPADFATLLPGHAVRSVAQLGWAGILNGELLERAKGQFDAFITMDRKLPEQQRIAGLPFGVLVLRAPSNRLLHLRPLVSQVLDALGRLTPGSVLIVGT